MKLRYETGVATYVQFIVVSLLALVNQINSTLVSCIHHDECISNIIPNTGYFIVTAFVFGLIWMLGWFAQEKRSRWLALGLIGIELLAIKVAEHNAKHHTDILGLVSSIINIILA